jgi:hypothetical protein
MPPLVPRVRVANGLLGQLLDDGGGFERIPADGGEDALVTSAMAIPVDPLCLSRGWAGLVAARAPWLSGRARRSSCEAGGPVEYDVVVVTARVLGRGRRCEARGGRPRTKGHLW